MGVLTLKIDDDIERRLRRRVGQKGAARGALSKGVEEALVKWLGEAKKEERTFVAAKGGMRVAEDATLEGLAQKLKAENLDPRDVVIQSIPPPPSVVRMGLRTLPDQGEPR